MGALVATGIATSRAGRTGGYRLARDPSSISVLEVIEVGEGGIGLARCPCAAFPATGASTARSIPTMWNATEAIRETLRATTLADLADEELRLAGEGEPRQSDGEGIGSRR